MVPYPTQCVDLETGNRFWRFLRGEIVVHEPEERVRLHQHTWQCRGCLREIARSWLRKQVLKRSNPGVSSFPMQAEEHHLEVLLALIDGRFSQWLG